MSVDTSRIPSPMQGVCYQPAPTDYIGNQGPGQKYFDTDFFNSDFKGIWSSEEGGRGDLANMADLGINFLHLYDWNPQRNHRTFLEECNALGIFVAVPFNNSFCTNLSTWGADAIHKAMHEIYDLGGGSTPYSQVAMWTIGNEFNQTTPPSPTPTQIAQVAQIIVHVEQHLGNSLVLPISAPTSFAPAELPGIGPTKQIQYAFEHSEEFTAVINGVQETIRRLPEGFFDRRYVAATNPQNPGSIPPAYSGVTIASWLPQYRAAFPKTPLWFSEIGIGVQNSCTGYVPSCAPSSTQQADFTKNQLQNADPSQSDFLLGSCIYEYTPDYQNSPITSNNYTFSLLIDDGGTTARRSFTIPPSAPAGGGETYPVQCLLTSNPVYAAVKTLWNPSPPSPPSPARYCPADTESDA